KRAGVRNDGEAPRGAGRARRRHGVEPHRGPGRDAPLRTRVHGRARRLARQLLRPGAARMKRALAIVALAALSLPAPSFARGKFDPTTEFEQHEWIPIHIGPLNLSVTKAVVYLLIGTGLTILLGVGTMRIKRPGRAQTIGEQIYEIAEGQVAEQGLPSK